MKKITWIISGLILFTLLFISCTDDNKKDNEENFDFSGYIVSPYKNVNWSTFGQYKASLHTHTTNSDGLQKLDEVIETLYARNYDILAITDHSSVAQVTTKDWVSERNGLTQERYEVIAAGSDRNGRGMLMIPDTSEQLATGNREEFNAFFFPTETSGINTYNIKLNAVEEANGLAFINHPGRATGGNGGDMEPKDWFAGEAASYTLTHINRYTDLFLNYPSLIGMEIINKKDGESLSDRILWDNILAETIPQGKYVWGFANDDSHNINEVGVNYNMFVMKENTLEEFRSAMINGNFYAVARVARRELGNTFEGTGDLPRITNIAVNGPTITITAINQDSIKWVNELGEFHSGNSINVTKYSNIIDSYIRAYISGPGGIIFTQPFGVKWEAE